MLFASRYRIWRAHPIHARSLPRVSIRALAGLRFASTSNSKVQSSIQDAFVDIHNALSLVNQGDRLKVAESQASELSKELEVSGPFT